ncbi:MAG: low molecular weight protein tyrosine phosphatase family protein [Pseudomonadota bacterium]
MNNLLFICGKNKWRSPTAEQIFAEHPGVACASAGLANDSEVLVSADLVEWADMIFVMEKTHKTKLATQFNAQLLGKRVVVLGIPDNYKFMEPPLIALLKKKVTPFLP